MGRPRFRGRDDSDRPSVERKTRTITGPKHDSRRTIAMTEPVAERLFELPRESRWVFTTLRGTRYRPTTRAFHWNRVRCPAGTGNTSLYLATRHFLGWYGLNVLDLPPHVIALQLGHMDGGKLVRETTGTRTRRSPGSVCARRSARPRESRRCRCESRNETRPRAIALLERNRLFTAQSPEPALGRLIRRGPAAYSRLPFHLAARLPPSPAPARTLGSCPATRGSEPATATAAMTEIAAQPARVAAEELACLDGRLAPASETVIPATDDGLVRGDGAFEVVRVYAGRPFALAEHLIASSTRPRTSASTRPPRGARGRDARAARTHGGERSTACCASSSRAAAAACS